jgi:uncharacterized protein (DUF433 family)
MLAYGGGRTGGSIMRVGDVISRHPEVLSGVPVFTGTRVPIQTLIDYLKAGDTLDEFLDGFPSVKREQAEAFLEMALDLVLAGENHARAA